MNWKRIWRVVFSVTVANVGWLAGATLSDYHLRALLALLITATFIIGMAIVVEHLVPSKPPMTWVITLIHLVIFTVALLFAWGVR